jgi:penicillin-binding protein 1C
MLLARPAMSRGGARRSASADGQRGTICWPGGQSLPAGEQLPTSPGDWLLDDSQPPTLLLPGQEGGAGFASRSG